MPDRVIDYRNIQTAENVKPETTITGLDSPKDVARLFRQLIVVCYQPVIGDKPRIVFVPPLKSVELERINPEHVPAKLLLPRRKSDLQAVVDQFAAVVQEPDTTFWINQRTEPKNVTTLELSSRLRWRRQKVYQAAENTAIRTMTLFLLDERPETILVAYSDLSVKPRLSMDEQEVQATIDALAERYEAQVAPISRSIREAKRLEAEALANPFPGSFEGNKR